MLPYARAIQARRALSGLLHEGKQALKAKEVSAALLAAEQVCGQTSCESEWGCKDQYLGA